MRTWRWTKRKSHYKIFVTDTKLNEETNWKIMEWSYNLEKHYVKYFQFLSDKSFFFNFVKTFLQTTDILLPRDSGQLFLVIICTCSLLYINTFTENTDYF